MNTTCERLENCIELLRRGELTEDDLRGLTERGDGAQQGAMQSLLYAQTWDNSVYSGIDGMRLIRFGHHQEVPVNPEEWPYRSVIDAIRDGWRIIEFPRFFADDSRNYGLGCEFILEKIEVRHEDV